LDTQAQNWIMSTPVSKHSSQSSHAASISSRYTYEVEEEETGVELAETLAIVGLADVVGGAAGGAGVSMHVVYVEQALSPICWQIFTGASAAAASTCAGTEQATGQAVVTVGSAPFSQLAVELEPNCVVNIVVEEPQPRMHQGIESAIVLSEANDSFLAAVRGIDECDTDLMSSPC